LSEVKKVSTERKAITCLEHCLAMVLFSTGSKLGAQTCHSLQEPRLLHSLWLFTLSLFLSRMYSINASLW